MTELTELLVMRRKDLMEVLRGGFAVLPEALDDTEYKGTSLGLPELVERATWKKFKKVFHRDPESGVLRGWNVRLEQNALEEPCVPMRKPDGEPLTFGHYQVVDPRDHRVPRGCDRGLLIHYGLGGNARTDPMGWWVRDPIVAVREGDATLLLGWSYLDLGIARLPTPSFFTLELDGPLSHWVKPPRQR